MGEKIIDAERCLRLWASARLNSDVNKLGYDDMSPQEKLNHVRGGVQPDESSDEKAIGSFMWQQPKIDKTIASMIWGPSLYESKRQMYESIKDKFDWGHGKSKRFENKLLQRVAREVV